MDKPGNPFGDDLFKWSSSEDEGEEADRTSPNRRNRSKSPRRSESSERSKSPEPLVSSETLERYKKEREALQDKIDAIVENTNRMKIEHERLKFHAYALAQIGKLIVADKQNLDMLQALPAEAPAVSEELKKLIRTIREFVEKYGA